MFVEFEDELLNALHILRVTPVRESCNEKRRFGFYLQIALPESFLAYHYEDRGRAEEKRAEIVEKLREVRAACLPTLRAAKTPKRRNTRAAL